MKKAFLILAFLSLGLLIGWIPVDDTNKKPLANVEQVEGIYIFLLSKPVTQTEYLGSVKVGSTITGNPLSVLIRKCKKDYPQAEALIISDPDLQKAKADAVKFK